jgi:hypothetical protein
MLPALISVLVTSSDAKIDVEEVVFNEEAVSSETEGIKVEVEDRLGRSSDRDEDEYSTASTLPALCKLELEDDNVLVVNVVFEMVETDMLKLPLSLIEVSTEDIEADEAGKAALESSFVLGLEIAITLVVSEEASDKDELSLVLPSDNVLELPKSDPEVDGLLVVGEAELDTSDEIKDGLDVSTEADVLTFHLEEKAVSDVRD